MINIFANLALVAGWWGFRRWAPKALPGHHRYALDDRSHHADLCGRADAGFRRSPPAAKGEASSLEVGTGTAISNIAEWGGFNVTFIIATWVSIAANAVYGYSVQVMGVCFMFYLGIATATSVRVAELSGGAIRKR